MADLTAIVLRNAARDVMLLCGARGFMRFARPGDALLTTDSIRRCPGGEARLIAALEEAGFSCARREGLLELTPGDDWIRTLADSLPVGDICWDSELHPAQALAARWAAQLPLPFTDAGRRLVRDVLRLTGQPGARVLEELDALRAHTAVMLRTGDRSGMYEAGRILSEWCIKEERA